ncbi:unnamed protein product [Rotaria sordida]|uniref:RNA-directed RNA polymerase n=1 Tax=Rotaria sordida TaxID=392033 RepID=A0A819FXW2_9BILA|nr:unnamed protein product [Rotaria sordida]
MQELKYIHYRDNDFNGNIFTYNRVYYSYSKNISNYLSYNNNIHHYQEQSQIKRLSTRIRQQIHMNQYQRQLLRSHRYSQKKQINNNYDLTTKFETKCNQDQNWFRALLKCVSPSTSTSSTSNHSLSPHAHHSQSTLSTKVSPLIDFSFKTILNSSSNICPCRITLIVDGASTSLNNLCHMFEQLNIDLAMNNNNNRKVQVEHDLWCFGGLDAYTFTLANSKSSTFSLCINKLKQFQLTKNDLFWFTFPRIPLKIDENIIDNELNSSIKIEFIDLLLNPFEIKDNEIEFDKKFCTLNEGIYVEMSFGSLVSLGSFHCFETIKKFNGIIRTWKMTFYQNHFDIDYQKTSSDNLLEEYRKRIKSEFIDNCAVINTLNDGFLIYLNIKANCIDYYNHDRTKPGLDNFIRVAPRESRPLCSTFRLLIKLDNNALSECLTNHLNEIKLVFSHFLSFFSRNNIAITYGSIQTSPGLILRPLKPPFSSFIKNYAWSILISLGYRFHQRVTPLFTAKMYTIEDDEDFYHTCIHLWRRTKEYLFVNLYEELIDYLSRQARIRAEERQTFLLKTTIKQPPKNYQYVPSVTLTPTTIIIKPLKLCKTNRVLREKKFGGPFNFALVEIREEDGGVLYPLDFRQIRWKLKQLLVDGFTIVSNRLYKYLHHSQSQLKEKQFWFYYHHHHLLTNNIDEYQNLSFEDSYLWMGNFDSERVVAKHTARIAQCFTSTEETIQIPAECVKYIHDVETADGKYNFTDGCGTMSTILRDEIKNKLGLHYPFSVMQIRYGGCKGVLSVCPELNGCSQQLVLRHSMRKFSSDHDILESCRISAPRPLYLNRQTIVLLSHRHVHDVIFLLLQQEHNLWLIESLLYPSITYDFLYDKLTRNFFPLRELFLDGQLNLAEEPFFRQLIVTFIHHDLIKMKEKSRTRIPKQSARNLIGVVDEYGVLEYGEVFVQFTNLRSKSLYRQCQSQNNSPNTNDFDDQILNEHEWTETTILNNIRVVVTKHPCHHPGDMRTFNAIDKSELRHLRDCIVFPQKGKRPHSNEISGSDLDGDEYAVFWLDLLVPNTENFEPYDYDSQRPPIPLSRSITRDDIVDVVLTISEQDCLGKLCCTHLAYVDKLGVQHDECVAIAAAISEELDAGKTGKHPFSEQKIKELNTKLDYKRPDYIDKDQFNLYPSEHVLGKLFRSILRSQSIWPIINHSAYHPEEKDPSYNILSTIERVPIDVHLIHPSYHQYTSSALDLYRTYRDALLNIMVAYHFVSDIDLICRFDSQQQQCMSKHIDVADSAQVELKALMDRIKTLFYAEFNAKEEAERLRISMSGIGSTVMNMNKEGEIAYLDEKLAKASACYVVCYQYEQAQHPKRILSFPWLFSRLLLQLRQRNLAVMAKAIDRPIVQLREHAIVARVMKNALMGLVERRELRFYVEFIDNTTEDLTIINKEIILRLDDQITGVEYDNVHIHLIEIIFIEIIHNWLYRQRIFDTNNNNLSIQKKLIINEQHCWQHILTKFIYEINEGGPFDCSNLIIRQGQSSENYYSSIKNFLSYWPYDGDNYNQWTYDEYISTMYHHLLRLSSSCSRNHLLNEEKFDFCYLHEYLILALQGMAAGIQGQQDGWADLQFNDDDEQ